jgi:putative transposase
MPLAMSPLLNLVQKPDHDQRQRWKTFLRNHKDGIAAMDFIVVPTVRFRLLYVWFVIGHGSRRIPTLRDRPSNITLGSSAAARGFPRRIGSAISHLRQRLDIFRTGHWVGSALRELLDHVIVLHERHLHRLLREYVDYYNEDRVHTQLRDSPKGRPTEFRPSSDAQVIGFPRVGGLHHRYEWREAA